MSSPSPPESTSAPPPERSWSLPGPRAGVAPAAAAGEPARPAAGARGVAAGPAVDLCRGGDVGRGHDVVAVAGVDHQPGDLRAVVLAGARRLAAGHLAERVVVGG